MEINRKANDEVIDKVGEFLATMYRKRLSEEAKKRARLYKESKLHGKQNKRGTNRTSKTN